MADNISIDNLQIEISSEANTATSSIDNLAQSLKNLNASTETSGLKKIISKIKSLAKAVDQLDVSKLQEISKSLQEMSGLSGAKIKIPTLPNVDKIKEKIDGQISDTVTGKLPELPESPLPQTNDISKSSRGFSEISKRVLTLSEAFKKASGSSNKFISSIKRIIMYRAIRAALKLITQSIKEGIQNLVLYSKAIGGVDSAAANSTMSAYATQFLQIKNAIGAAAMPALQALLPIIQKISGWFITAANAVNQFMSAFQGKTTFTKAKAYAVDYADSLGGVSKAAKEAQKQIAAFDELNVLERPTSTSGGGASMPDYSQMFEESTIDPKFQKAVQWLKDHLEEIKILATTIGVIIATWKIVSSFLSGLDKINSLLKLIGISAGEAFIYFIGAAAIVAGIVLIIDGIRRAIKEFKKFGTVSWKTCLEIFAGLLLIGAGLSLITGSWIPLAVAAGIAAVGILAKIIYDNWEAIKKFFDNAWKWIKEHPLLTDLIAIVLAPGIAPIIIAVKRILTVITDNAEAIKSFITTTVDNIVEIVKKRFEIIGKFFEIIWAWAKWGFGKIQQGWNAMVNWLGEKWQLFTNTKFYKFFEDLFKKVKSFVQPVIDWITESIRKTLNWIVGGIEKNINGIINGLNQVINFTNRITGSNIKTVERISLKTYATGGMPETGQLFIARESGAELVGTMGGKTTVANNQQIETGIYNAVLNAMREANANNRNNNGYGDIYLDGTKVGKMVAKPVGNELYRTGFKLRTSEA